MFSQSGKGSAVLRRNIGAAPSLSGTQEQAGRQNW